MNILVTGVSGFIGCEIAIKLVAAGHQVVGIDNLNDYYDVQLKLDRLKRLEGNVNFDFIKMGIDDRIAMDKLASEHTFEQIIHMAA